MMDAVDRLVLEGVFTELFEAEAAIARTDAKLKIAREMVSVLLEHEHDLTQKITQSSQQLFHLREQFYELKRQVALAQRQA